MSNSTSGVSSRAVLVAVATAFVVGLLASLAVRPTDGGTTTTATQATFESARVRLKWRMPVSFQSTMPVLGDNPIYVTEQIRKMTSGEIDITIYEPGEIVPAFSITDAVRDHKVPVGYTWLGYDQGKIPASALLGAVPFGMEPWEFAAWWYEAGGRELGQQQVIYRTRRAAGERQREQRKKHECRARDAGQVQTPDRSRWTANGS